MLGAAALAAVPWNRIDRAFAAGPFVRRSVTDLGAARSSPISAPSAPCCALPPTDPRNWYRQAIIHLLDCPHANWWFLPWHRGYLLHFEEICRQLSGGSGVRAALLGLDSRTARSRRAVRRRLTPTHELYEESFETFRPEVRAGDRRSLERPDGQRSASSLACADMRRRGDIWERLEKILLRARRGPGPDARQARSCRTGRPARWGRAGERGPGADALRGLRQHALPQTITSAPSWIRSKARLTTTSTTRSAAAPAS